MPDSTRALLLRWHEGDEQALAKLIAEHLTWIHQHVQARLGPLLRQRGEAGDYAQDAIAELLRYRPRFVVDSGERFRALVARIVENQLRDEAKGLRRARRDAGRERELPSDSVLHLDAPADSVTRPSAAAGAKEWQALVQLGVELLEPLDRLVVRRREWDGRSFAEIAAELGVGESAARMRFERALPKLADRIQRLRQGEVDALLAAAERGEGDG